MVGRTGSRLQVLNGAGCFCTGDLAACPKMQSTQIGWIGCETTPFIEHGGIASATMIEDLVESGADHGEEE